MKPDFSGYATRANVKCSDGRTILPDAFKHCDGQEVPLVWQHGHNDVNSVLGHAKLEHRADGVYAYGKFNGTESGQKAKDMVSHGDIKAMSIYANKLTQDGSFVKHGSIVEVSLVLSGANPEARIENVYIKHSAGYEEEVEDALVIHSGDVIHVDEGEEDGDDVSIADILNSMTPEQRDVTEYLVAQAATDSSDEDDDDEEETTAQHSDDSEGELMHKNVFENNGEGTSSVLAGDNVLTHSDIRSIFEDADQNTKSLQASLKSFIESKPEILSHAESKGYGVDNLEFLFPDAKNLSNTPEFISRQMEWVTGVLSGAKKIPFTRIKTLYADITADEARAKGYITGNMKKEEFFGLAKRETSPTTIYKKQKLDRDDIIDVTTLDIVNWLWAEMRVMLNEEIARAILIGDGREIDDPDHINAQKIRPIATDHSFFCHKLEIDSTNPRDFEEALLRNKKHYKGSGSPTLYTSEDIVTEMLLQRDELGRKMYNSEAELASALRVKNIVTLDLLDDEYKADTTLEGLVGIIVNMSDYVIGTDKGGEITKFDDFDIDFNQYKYLIEGRMSGSLVRRKSAISIWKTGTVVEEGENISPSDFSQQIDPRSNHPQYQSQEAHDEWVAEKGTVTPGEVTP